MGSVFRKSYTKPLPLGVEISERKGERLARWRNAKRKLQTAPITVGRDGSERLLIESGIYTAKFRDGSGIVVERPTGCRDRDAAKQMLAGWERQAERIRAGLITASEARTAGQLAVPIGDHVEVYLTSLEASGATVDLTALIALGNWCVTSLRLTSNPFKGIPKADTKTDPRRRRRSMTEEELKRLLDAARRRPLVVGRYEVCG